MRTSVTANAVKWFCGRCFLGSEGQNLVPKHWNRRLVRAHPPQQEKDVSKWSFERTYGWCGCSGQVATMISNPSQTDIRESWGVSALGHVKPRAPRWPRMLKRPSFGWRLDKASTFQSTSIIYQSNLRQLSLQDCQYYLYFLEMSFFPSGLQSPSRATKTIRSDAYRQNVSGFAWLFFVCCSFVLFLLCCLVLVLYCYGGGLYPFKMQSLLQ